MSFDRSAGINSALPLPLSMAFVRLFFSIFPVLASFGAGDGKKHRNDPSATSDETCFKRALNSRERVERALPHGELQSNADHRTYLHPYRSYGNKAPLQLVMNHRMDLSSMSVPLHALLDHQQPQNFPHNQTVAGATGTPDYGELKFYGQLKKLLDLPVLFAICFVQLISFVLVLNIEECSPLVLFSWWRNKIS